MKDFQAKVGKKARLKDGGDVQDLHDPIYRELEEPVDGHEPTPTWIVFLCFLLIGFGGWYLANYDGSWSGEVYDEHARGGSGASAVESAPLDPMVLGRRVFNNCMACHQKDGRGLEGNYPPLDGSEWTLGRPEVPIAIILHGLEGPLVVHNKEFDQVMPKWDHLSDEQIAAVLSYERNSWSNSAGMVGPEFVAAVRAATADRKNAWTARELESLVIEDLPDPEGVKDAVASGGEDG